MQTVSISFVVSLLSPVIFLSLLYNLRDQCRHPSSSEHPLAQAVILRHKYSLGWTTSTTKQFDLPIRDDLRCAQKNHQKRTLFLLPRVFDYLAQRFSLAISGSGIDILNGSNRRKLGPCGLMVVLGDNFE